MTLDISKDVSILLEKLAEKLGTTSQYLWQVLIKQAPISATINLIEIILVGVFGVILWKLHKKFYGNMPGKEYSYYSEMEELIIVPMMVGMMIFVVVAIAGFCSIETIITGFVNPEYWALNKILDKIK